MSKMYHMLIFIKVEKYVHSLSTVSGPHFYIFIPIFAMPTIFISSSKSNALYTFSCLVCFNFYKFTQSLYSTVFCELGKYMLVPTMNYFQSNNSSSVEKVFKFLFRKWRKEKDQNIYFFLVKYYPYNLRKMTCETVLYTCTYICLIS